MQQQGLRGVGVLAQVEFQLAFLRLGLEPERALLPRQVPLERYDGCRVRDLAEHVADDEAVLDERERYVGAVAHHRPDRFQSLRQAGQRSAPHGGQGLGQPDRLDDVRRGDLPVLLAQQAGDLGQPPLDGPVPGGEEVGVPAGRGDPRAVPAGPGEPAVRPRHPGGLHLDLRQSGQQRLVGGHGGLRPQRRDVPGPAHHGVPVAELAAGGAHPLPHVRLAHQVAAVSAVAVRLAQGRHGLPERLERAERLLSRVPRAAGAPVLDHVLPPALGVVVPGGLGEHREGVQPDRVGLGAVRVRLPGGGQRVCGGQVHEPDRYAGLLRPADGHPLRGEVGERPERGPARVVRGVREQRHGRPHAGVGGQFEQGVPFGRPLDQHGRRTRRVQGGADRAGRSGPVVAHAEKQRALSGGAHAVTSRQAR